jgi:Tfp pilus assembly protein PilF
MGDLQFPIAHLGAVESLSGRQAQQTAATSLQGALCELERGDGPAAAAALEDVVATAPDSPLWPLVRAYWYCLKGELLDELPNDRIPMEELPFAPEQ